MIEMQIIKNECKKHKRCNEECVFYDTEVSIGCLLRYDPCDWDIPAITEAFEKMSDKTYTVCMSERGAGRSYFYERMKKLKESEKHDNL